MVGALARWRKREGRGKRRGGDAPARLLCVRAG